ncbi:hypothetical protein BIW11_10178, partial [Tropilaelaps mercedesae]
HGPVNGKLDITDTANLTKEPLKDSVSALDETFYKIVFHMSSRFTSTRHYLSAKSLTLVIKCRDKNIYRSLKNH